ncbi:MAG: IclR family transcriptional regulator C-terminal domain-containing protein, partial [Microbacterium sp.]
LRIFRGHPLGDLAERAVLVDAPVGHTSSIRLRVRGNRTPADLRGGAVRTLSRRHFTGDPLHALSSAASSRPGRSGASRGRTTDSANTLATAEALLSAIAQARRLGYAVDDQENEIGINCVAIPVSLDGAATPSGAISISAVSFRCPIERLVEAVPDIRATIGRHLGPNALGRSATATG